MAILGAADARVWTSGEVSSGFQSQSRQTYLHFL